MLEPLPVIRPRQRGPSIHGRDLPASTAFSWLGAGWRDLKTSPWSSLGHGLALVMLSYAILAFLWATDMHYLALPAISGFLIIGPFFAIGLYEKSRRLEEKGTPDPVSDLERNRSPAVQIAFAGLLLGLLVLFWLRAADLLYALYFGIHPFPGAEDAMVNVFTTDRGWALLVVGTLVGGLFAAFAFALSLFSIPMMVAENRDALTAMGLSFALTARNLGPCFLWGVIVVAGLMISVATGLLGFIVIFPLLGHGTWHAWRAIGAET